MAVHTGVADRRDGDYFGPALNRVARLLEVCHAGQVLLSGATRELVQDSLPRDAALKDLGYYTRMTAGLPVPSPIGAATHQSLMQATALGRYLYGDLCAGEVRSVRLARGRATGDRGEGVRVPFLSSFGEDGRGRAYVVSLRGPVYRLTRP